MKYTRIAIGFLAIASLASSAPSMSQNRFSSTYIAKPKTADAQLKDSLESISILRKENKILSDKLYDAEIKSKETSQKLKDAESQNKAQTKNLNDTIKALKKALKESDNAKRTLEGKFQKALSSITTLEERLKTAETPTAIAGETQSPANNESHAKALAEAHSEIGNLRTRLGDANAKLAAIESANKAQLDSISHALAEAKAKLVATVAQSEVAPATGSVNAQVKSLQKQVVELQAMVDDMAIFRKEFLKSKLKESDSYLKTAYSEMDIAKIESFKKSLAEYASDKDVKAHIAKLDIAIANKRMCQRMENVLASPFSVAAIKEIDRQYDSFESAHKTSLSDAQEADFKRLNKNIKNYNPTVIVFQTIIGDTQKELKEFEGETNSMAQKDCIKHLKPIMEGKDDYFKAAISKGIMVIPYLAERFTVYKKWALSNPLVKNNEIVKIESEIMNLKPIR